MNGTDHGDLDAAWRAVAAAWAARVTDLPVQWVRKYNGPIDVDAFVAEFQVPADPRDHARSFVELRAAFRLRFEPSLFQGAA